MSSINFNSAATQALRTLQTSNSQLDATQKRISTGLAIGEAKDNAAYWSISTTLKSDNKAMGTVKDALGLGAATVDTAYQGLNAVKDVLDEIKSKITAATQDGVDKTAVQAEIAELQKQLKAIATSSAFAGENWLSVDSSAVGYTADRQVVSSFIRDSSGSVSIGTVGIDISKVALFDSSATGEGILNGGKDGNATKTGQITSGVASATPTATTARGAISTFAFAGTHVVGEALSIDVTIDNGRTQTIKFSAGADASAAGANFKTALDAAFGSLVTVTATTGTVTVNTASTAATSRIVFGTMTADDGATTITGTPTSTQTGRDATYNAAALDFSAFVAANDKFTLDIDDTISFQIAVDGKEAQTVTISKATVSKALGSTDGEVNDLASMRLVLTQALSDAKIEGVTATDDGTNITLTSQNTTSNSKIDVFGEAASKGTSVESINVVGASKVQMASYINTVNTAIDRVTSAAANLGAVAARIDLQKSFVENLMDTIDKGVSGLVDADMNEESTKLQALQVKQQLGVQALSIANQSAQNVLRLSQ